MPALIAWIWHHLGAANLLRAAIVLVFVFLYVRACSAPWFRRAAAILAIVLAVIGVYDIARVKPMPLASQPAPDSQEYVDAALHMARGDGYVTTAFGGGARRPRYPPGMSAALVPFASDAGTVQTGAKAIVALYFVSAFAAAWLLGGPIAGGLAAIIVGTAPFTMKQAAIVLSDPLAAALTIGTAMALINVTRKRAALAGLLAGVSALVRLPLLINVAAATMAARRRWYVVAAAALPGIIALLVYNYIAYGSALRTGYERWHGQMFSLQNVIKTPPFGDGPYIVPDGLQGRLMQWVCPCPPGGPESAMSNLAYYPAVLSGLLWVYAPPLFSFIGIYGLWRRRKSADAQFAAIVIATTLAVHLLYFYQGARFMVAPATLLVIYGSTAVADWLTARGRPSPSTRPGKGS